MSAHAKIQKSRSKRNPFRVRHIATNGKQLGNPELLSTRRNVAKNLIAYMDLFNGEKVFVIDETVEPVRKYTLYKDGMEESEWKNIPE